MRSIFLLLIAGCCCGCSSASELNALKSSLRITGETIEIKQDESLVILKENTTALAAIKSQVEALAARPIPVEKEVIKSALEPQKPPQANGSQPSKPVASASAVRLTSDGMKWDIEGNKSPSILETARHLREAHGIIADGLSHQQMHDMHAAVHEGRLPVAVRSQPVRLINRGTSCPNGRCPTVSTKRRGLFGWRR